MTDKHRIEKIALLAVSWLHKASELTTLAESAERSANRFLCQRDETGGLDEIEAGDARAKARHYEECAEEVMDVLNDDGEDAL